MNRIKIKFVHNRRKNNKIELYVYFGLGRKMYVDAGIMVEQQQWNGTQVVKYERKEYLNAQLARLKNSVENDEHRMIMQGQDYSPEMLRRFLNNENNDSFADFAIRQIRNDNSLQHSTKEKQLRFVTVLSGYKPNITFTNINFELVHGFDNFLKQKYSHNTVLRFHKDFKKFIRLAINYKLMPETNNPYLIFKPGSWKAKTVFLYPWEVDAIAALDLSAVKIMHTVQQMFLFACYTGLRHSDLHMLHASNFEQRKEGIVLNLKSKKTGMVVFLRLYELFDGRPQYIIEPYFQNPSPKAYIWERFINNSTMNSLLKDIGSMANINKPLTSHIARHTFGTNYAKQSGSIFQVMAAMGITKYETAQVYINLAAMI